MFREHLTTDLRRSFIPSLSYPICSFRFTAFVFFAFAPAYRCYLLSLEIISASRDNPNPNALEPTHAERRRAESKIQKEKKKGKKGELKETKTRHYDREKHENRGNAVGLWHNNIKPNNLRHHTTRNARLSCLHNAARPSFADDVSAAAVQTDPRGRGHGADRLCAHADHVGV